MIPRFQICLTSWILVYLLRWKIQGKARFGGKIINVVLDSFNLVHEISVRQMIHGWEL